MVDEGAGRESGVGLTRTGLDRLWMDPVENADLRFGLVFLVGETSPELLSGGGVLTSKRGIHESV